MPRISAAAALSILGASAQEDLSGRLVLYTSQPNEDAQQTVDAFNELHTDVEVDRDGTTQMMARLRAEFEAGQPQPDVLLIADTVTMESLEQEGRLMPHPDADTLRLKQIVTSALWRATTSGSGSHSPHLRPFTGGQG